MPLSPEEVQLDSFIFQDFKGSKYYAVWHKYLELMCEQVEARLINGEREPLDVLRLLQGQLQGLKMAAQVPENVELWAKQAQKENGSLGSLKLS